MLNVPVIILWCNDKSVSLSCVPRGHGSSLPQPPVSRPVGPLYAEGPMLFMLPSSVGSSPVMLLCARLMIWTLLRRPISVGIAPSRPFHERSMYVKFARSPSSGTVRLPRRLFRRRSSEVIRPAKQPWPLPRTRVRKSVCGPSPMMSSRYFSHGSMKPTPYHRLLWSHGSFALFCADVPLDVFQLRLFAQLAPSKAS